MPDGESPASAPSSAARSGRSFAAFLSYSHRDDDIGEWLQKRLETYQVPAPLVGRQGPNGPIGKRLGKVFRDRADLSAAHDLGAEIRAALEDAEALIVLCSPRSCGSRYVNEELRTFKQLGRGKRIVAAIVDGEPHAASKPGRSAADECFPPALIYRLGGDGQISSHPEANEPIAADFREGKDGRENGSLKLIAGLLDVGLDELVQREKQAERARRRRANAIATAMAVLALGALGAGGVAWWQRNVAEQNEARAIRGETDARAAQAEAEQNAREREEQRQLADYNAEQAHIQELAARQGEADARNALARIFAERTWQAMEREDYPLAARYALAGLRSAPDNAGEYRMALGRLLHDANESQPLLGHSGAILSAAFSSDGARVLIASDDGKVRVWSAASGRKLLEFQVAEEHLAEAVFDGSGSRLATSGDGKVRIWDTVTGREIVTLVEGGSVARTAFNSGGTRVATSSDEKIQVWDVASGREIAAIQHLRDSSGSEANYAVSSMAFSPDGSHLLILLGAYGGRLVAVDSGRATELGEHDFTNARFDPSGTRLVVPASGEGAVRVLDVASGREIVALPEHTSSADRVAFSPSGTQIVTAQWADNTARIWDAASGRELVVLRGHRSRLASAIFSPDGSLITTTSFDGTMRVWRVRDGREIAVFHVGGADAVLSPDGARILTLGDPPRLWDNLRGRQIAEVQYDQEAALSGLHIDLSRDGANAVVGAGNSVGVWDLTRGRRIALMQQQGLVRSVAFNSDGTRVVTTSHDGAAFIWDASSGREIRSLPHTPSHTPNRQWAVVDAAFSPNDAYIVTASNPRRGGYGAIRVWDVATGSEVAALLGHNSLVFGAAFSPRGDRIVTAGGDHTARIWNVETWTEIAALRHEAAAVGSAAFNADGTRVVTATRNGAHVWDLASGRELITLRPESEGLEEPSANMSSVLSLLGVGGGMRASFSPDGARIITTSSDLDNLVRFSDTASGREIMAMEGDAAAISSDGARLAIVAPGAISVWDIHRLTAPIDALARAACSHLLPPTRGARTFSALEINADPIIREVWLRDARGDRDVCEAIAGAPPLELEPGPRNDALASAWRRIGERAAQRQRQRLEEDLRR